MNAAIANERERVSGSGASERSENVYSSAIIITPATLSSLSPALPSALGAGDYLRLANEGDPAGGGRAKDKRKAIALAVFLFVFVGRDE